MLKELENKALVLEIILEIQIKKTCPEETWSLYIRDRETVQDIKNIIERDYNIPKNRQILRYEDKILTDDEYLFLF